MPLPTTSLSQHSLLTSKAVGPFSFCYQRGDCSIARMTEYPAPDGAWNWASCPASVWTPELAGIPPAAWSEYWVAKNKLFSE